MSQVPPHTGMPDGASGSGSGPALPAGDAFDREALALAEQSAGVGVWSIDLVSGTVRGTTQFFRIMGLEPTAEPVPVDAVRRLRHPDDAERVLAGFRRALEDGSDAYEIEYRILRPDGRERWIFGRGRVIRGADGTPLRYSGVDLDITDRKATDTALAEAKRALERMNEVLEQRVRERGALLEAEAARRVEAESRLLQMQKMEAVGQLTGGIAHDLNNILQVISGNLEIVKRAGERDTGTSEAGRAAMLRAIATAQRAAHSAKDVVQRLLAFGRRQPLAPARIDLNALVAEMTDIIDRALGAPIVVETALDAHAWPVFADRNQMESAVLNLVVNARDAMASGGRLRIETRNANVGAGDVGGLAPGRYVVLRVADTGCGIAPEHLDRVFEPFFTTKEPGRGSGLGLSMVWGFARQSGGHVGIESTLGVGTSVSVYLPVAPDEVLPASASPPGRPQGDVLPRARDGETILFVEDDADVRQLGVAALGDLGYRVVAAPDAHTALALLDTAACARVDLLFTDVVLPGGTSGRDLALRVRAARPRIPVLFASGYTRDALTRERGALRDAPLLNKPYSLDVLAAGCRRAIDGAADRGAQH